MPDRMDLIDDDLDENNRAHARIRSEHETFAQRVETKLTEFGKQQTQILVSLVTGALLLALNLAVMMGRS